MNAYKRLPPSLARFTGLFATAFGWLYIGAVFVFLLGPFAIILVTSFSSGRTLRFPPPGLSLQWYHRFLDHLAGAAGTRPGLVAALVTGTMVAASASALAVVVGVLAAYALARGRLLGRDVVRQVFVLPIIFPQIVTGIGLLVFFSYLGLFGPIERLVIGHAILCLPFVLLIIAANFELFDPAVEEAALGLGARPLQTFFLITLPLILPGLLAATAFSFIISFTNFTVTFFLVSGGVKTLPIWVFEVIEHFLDPFVAVISVTLLAMTVVIVLIINRLLGIARLFYG